MSTYKCGKCGERAPHHPESRWEFFASVSGRYSRSFYFSHVLCKSCAKLLDQWCKTRPQIVVKGTTPEGGSE